MSTPKYRWTSDKAFELINKAERDENWTILLGKKDPKEVCIPSPVNTHLLRFLHLIFFQNTSGESKTAVFKRIAIALFGQEYNAVTDKKG